MVKIYKISDENSREVWMSPWTPDVTRNWIEEETEREGLEVQEIHKEEVYVKYMNKQLLFLSTELKEDSEGMEEPVCLGKEI